MLLGPFWGWRKISEARPPFMARELVAFLDAGQIASSAERQSFQPQWLGALPSHWFRASRLKKPGGAIFDS
jgi:hypothetical protein